ncbi:MAG: DNA mismatch endonuclease Vsr [Candidatus Sulfotelmatobacter sp.]
MDELSPERRSANMARIRSQNTNPELTLRKLIHCLGYRFRLHRSDLPGRPDLVFPSRKKVIFVHGCFWHQHTECREGRVPGSRLEYWGPKLRRNRERDALAQSSLKKQGWRYLVVWECELRDTAAVLKRAKRFLETAHG